MASVRSILYALARGLGDVHAAAKGPGAYGRRVARKAVYRGTFRATSSLLRKLGL